LTTNGKAVSAYTGSPSLAVFVDIACFRDSGTLVPAGMVSVGLADSTEGAAGSGAKDDCAAAIPVAVATTSKTDMLATRILIEGLPLRDNFGSTLATSDAAREC
jgi:hypothetical protein